MLKLHHRQYCLLRSTATQALGALASVSARTHLSDTEFVVELVSTPQPQALNQNPSTVLQFFYPNEMPDFINSNTQQIKS